MTEKTGEVRLGALLVTAAAVAYSTAGYYTRVIDLAVWTVLFWRGIYGGLAILAYIAWLERRSALAAFLGINRAGVAVALCSALATIVYINAFKYTGVADVFVICATLPFGAAALAWAFTGERTSAATLIASAVAVMGVAITFSGASTSGHLFGHALSIATVIFLSIMMVIIRTRSDISMLPAACLSAFLCSALVLPFAAPATARGTNMGLLVLFGATQFGLGLLLLTVGTRMISAARSGLIITLDVPLAALWVWLALGEAPTAAAFVGGLLIMAAVVGDTLAQPNASKKPDMPTPENAQSR
jgi:drug/metabolite transporter (DMT)-like permease